MADPSNWKLIVGLGNPGRQYASTRHNVGFEVAGQLATRYGGSRPRGRFHGETVEIEIEGRRAMVLCPHTYMNRSGLSVAEASSFFKLHPADLLIICDDFHLPLGKLRFRARGSSGGQKGLQDILRCLATDELARLRFGIGTPPEGWDVADYVLSRFAADEQPLVRSGPWRPWLIGSGSALSFA
jgi:PTH1 family peptidyl-tRNA hydrolase